MKMFIFCTFLLFTEVCAGQTIELEKAYLNSLRDTDVKMYQDKGARWGQFLKTIGTYPTLNWDTTRRDFVFQRRYTYAGKSAKDILEKVRQWVAINYGDAETVTRYYNPEYNKLIVKGFFEVSYSITFETLFGKRDYSVFSTLNCYHTLIFDSKNGELNIEILNPRMKGSTGGYVLGSTYIPREGFETSLRSYVPVTKGSGPEYWVSILKLVSDVNTEINLTFDGVNNYIME